MHFEYFILIFILSFANIIYFYGYIQPKTYKSRIFNNITVKNQLTEQAIDKVILFIIDSLRYEMVYDRLKYWPHLTNKTGIYRAIGSLQPPTLSYARIKSITTGTFSNFIDALSNTNSGEIKEDNLIDILIKYRNFKIAFSGDDTWTRLLPNRFLYSFDVPPFFVPELVNRDIDVGNKFRDFLTKDSKINFGIIHFIGLDHLGHSEGPKGPNINKKLQEMDVFLNTFMKIINNSTSKSAPLVILTSDHGMSDLGGHGGCSKPEMTVPIIFMHPKLKYNHNIDSNVFQIDIPTAISLLTGVPIPLGSIGVIPEPLLNLFDSPIIRHQKLFQNHAHLSKLSNIKQKAPSENVTYSELRLLQTNLLRNFIHNYNWFYMDLAISFTLVALLICIVFYFKINNTRYIPIYICIFSIFSFIITYLFINSSNGFCLFRTMKLCFSGILICFTIHSINLIRSFIEDFRESIKNIRAENLVLSLIFSLVSVSVFVPSLVQEQHSIWYMFNYSLWILFLIRLLLSHEHILWSCILTDLIVIAVILVMDRICNSINNTGELHTDKEDIGDVLSRSENKVMLLFITMSCLVVMSFVNWYIYNCHDNNNNQHHRIIIIPKLVGNNSNKDHGDDASIPPQAPPVSSPNKTTYQSQLGTVSCANTIFIQIFYCLVMVRRVFEYYGNRMGSNMVSWICYGLLLMNVTFHITKSILSRIYGWLENATSHSSSSSPSPSSQIPQITCSSPSVRYSVAPPVTTTIIFLLNILTCRPHNLVIWTCILIKHIFIIKQIFPNILSQHSPFYQLLIFRILATLSYFQMGNSNSLTTIDVLPGFTGMPCYIPSLVDPLVAILTMSPLLYWHLALLPFAASVSILSFSTYLFTSGLLASILSLSLLLAATFYHHASLVSMAIYAPSLMFNAFFNSIVIVPVIFMAKFYL